MKINFNIKHQNIGVEADVEKILEKGMDQQDKNWKEKFQLKHNAKKEILEIKHKQKMEKEDKVKNKKSLIEKILEERRKIKEIELEEKRRQEETKKRIIKLKTTTSFVLGFAGMVMIVTGIILTDASGNIDSEWSIITLLGLFTCMSIPFIWGNELNKKNKTRKRKNKESRKQKWKA